MFKKILIANRGEIALRIQRACKELGIKTVAIHSEADAASLHVRAADEKVCVGPAEAALSYRNIPNVLSAAEITGADAIHPGYGFLSENARFSEIVKEHGITFIGPTPEHIRLMGDKIEAKAAMKRLGVPVVPGSDGPVPDEAAVFTEPLAAALQMLECVPIQPSQRVVLIGAGKLGFTLRVPCGVVLATSRATFSAAAQPVSRTASASRRPSLHARPKNVMPAGSRPSRVHPIGTVMAGKPVVGENTWLLSPACCCDVAPISCGGWLHVGYTSASSVANCDAPVATT